MEIKKLFEGCIHVDFETQEDLAKTFIRIQEHYESPKFQGEIFTLGIYREWYAKEYGVFSYYTDWNGFNIPGSAIKPFVDGLFDPLTKYEKKLIETVRYNDLRNFYIIGTHGGGDDGTLKHEIRHAKFTLNMLYRDAVLKQLEKYKEVLLPLEDWIINKGYNISVLKDETNAYLSDLDHLEEEGVKVSPLELLFVELEKLDRIHK